MESQNTDFLRYPIGKYKKPESIRAYDIEQWIGTIEQFPLRLKDIVAELTDEQLSITYRPGGWTIRQVVHHCADSHLNSIMRFKLALTEENPIIKPYLEAEWAKLSDMEAPVGWSLQLLEALHKKWVLLLRSLSSDQLKLTYYHPEQNREIPLDETIGLYAWHCDHHLAHIELAKNNK